MLPASKEILKAISICIAFCIIVLGLTTFGLNVSQSSIKTSIVNAFSSDALIDNNYFGNDERRGKYSFSDCLLLQTLLPTGRGAFVDSIDSNVLSDTQETPCKTLHKFLIYGTNNQELYPFSRYYWGAKLPTSMGLMLTGLDNVRTIISYSSRGILLFCVLLSSYFLMSRKYLINRSKSIVVLFVCLGLLTLYDLKEYSLTLAHGFSELVLSSYLMYFLLWAKPVPEGSIPIRLILFGAFTAWFELFTGPLVISAGVAILTENALQENPRSPLRQAIKSYLSVMLASALSLLTLQVFAIAFSNPKNALQFFYHLMIRMQLHKLVSIPIEKPWQNSENLHDYTVFEVFHRIASNLFQLTWGSYTVSSLIFGGSIFVLLACGVYELKTSKSIKVLIPIYFAILTLVAWYLIFMNHTAIHAFVMVRPMVLVPICAVLALFAIFSSRPKTPGDCFS